MNEAKPVWQRWHDPAEPIRIGVSACLLGAEVRFDGGHKRDRYLTDVLAGDVEWLPVCPELEIGLGIPRPVIQLRGGTSGDRFVLREAGTDLSAQMADYSQSRVSELKAMGLDGFIFKKGSPSCGLARVRVYPDEGEMPLRSGIGHFSRRVVNEFPGLPVEEEGRLNDAGLREQFIEAIFCHNRWRVFERRGLTRSGLVAFHEAHKMLILSHDEPIYRKLGRLVASFGREDDERIFSRYKEGFVAAFNRPAARKRHINVLEHLFGHLKRMIGPAEKKQIGLAIDDYRAGRVPLVVPISILRFLVESKEVKYVQGQLYLEPHPREMMLRNHA